MNNPTLRDGLRLGATVSAAIIALSAVAVIVSSSIATLAGGMTLSPDGASGGISYGSAIATSIILLAPVAFSRWTFYGQGYGAALPHSPITLRFVAGTMLTWFAMGATGVANLWMRNLLGQEQFGGLTVDDGTMIFIAFNAGVTEEAAYLAAPAGMLFLIFSLVSRWRVHSGRPPYSCRAMWLVAATAGPALVLVGRASGHLYQGPVSALMGAGWGLCLIAVFVWVRSVWPVMLGHVIYDLPVHYGSWAGLISYHVIAPAVIASLCLVWMRLARGRANQGETLPEANLPI